MFSSLTIRITAVAVVFSTLTGCTSMQALPSTRPVDVQSNVAVGDRIEILRTSGDRVEMKVDEKLPAGLQGSGQFVAYADMASIKVRQFDHNKAQTAIHVGAIAVAVVATLYALQGLSAVAGRSY